MVSAKTTIAKKTGAAKKTATAGEAVSLQKRTAARKASSKKESTALSYDVRVDERILKSEEFARPILEHVRDLAHKAAPDVKEEIKWGCPFFTLDGENLCFMGSFKTHCSFGFWSPRMKEYLQMQGVQKTEGAGSLGKIRTLKDLPKGLEKFIRHAAELIRKGEAGSPMAGQTRKKDARPKAEMHPEFAAALKKSPAASEFYQPLPPSAKREFLEWIASAKKDETRARRVSESIRMLEEGRRYNYKYRR